MEWLKGAGTAVKVTIIVVCGILALGVLAAYVYLTAQGADTTEFRSWILAIANLLIFPLVGVNTIASISAANSAKKAEENTNGNLHDRDDTIAGLQALARQKDEQIRRLGGNPR